MPFKSKQQVKFLFATNPKLAKEWVKKYPQNLKRLPISVKKEVNGFFL